MNDIELSIITPCYNEELNIVEWLTRVDATVKNMKVNYEIIVVDDGSSDNTAMILENLSNKFNKLKYIILSQNRGQTIAISAGVDHSVGKYIIIMDSDLQHLPEEIPILYNKILSGYDMISGKRKNRSESFFLRRFPSFVANFLIRCATGCKIYDQGGFKCIKGDIARKICFKSGFHRFIPAIVYQMGGYIGEVEITAPKRIKGKSNYGINRSIEVLLDILMLWFESSGKSRPLYFMGKISFYIFLISTGIIFWLILEKSIYGYPVSQRPPFYFSIFLYVVSFLVFLQALVLEFLSGIYKKSINNKGYIIKSHNFKNVSL